MKDSKTPFCCSKFPWVRDRISPKIIDKFGTRSQRSSSAVGYSPVLQNSYTVRHNTSLPKSFMSLTPVFLSYAFLGKVNTWLSDEKFKASLQTIYRVLRCTPHAFAVVCCVLWIFVLHIINSALILPSNVRFSQSAQVHWSCNSRTHFSLIFLSTHSNLTQETTDITDLWKKNEIEFRAQQCNCRITQDRMLEADDRSKLTAYSSWQRCTTDFEQRGNSEKIVPWPRFSYFGDAGWSFQYKKAVFTITWIQNTILLVMVSVPAISPKQKVIVLSMFHSN
jgi:hypothetical protein